MCVCMCEQMSVFVRKSVCVGVCVSVKEWANASVSLCECVC